MTSPPSLTTILRRVQLFAGLVFLPLALSLSGWFEFRAMTHEIATTMTGTADTCAVLVGDQLLMEWRRISNLLVERPRLTPTDALLLAAPATLAREALGVPTTLDRFDIPYVLDRTDHLVAAPAAQREYLGLDLGGMRKTIGATGISQVHQSLFGTSPVITFAFPLSDAGTLLVEKQLDDIVNLVSHLRMREFRGRGMLFILSEDGTVIVHPDPSLIHSRHNLGFELRDWQGPDAQGLSTFTLGGQHFIGHRKSLALPLGWTFYAVVPRKELRGEIARHLLLHVAPLLFFGLLLTLGLDQLLRHFLTRPIKELAARMAHIDPLGDAGEAPAPITGKTLELSTIQRALDELLDRFRFSTDQLAASEELFRTVTEFSSEWTYWIDQEQQVRYISEACGEISGYTPEEFRLRPELFNEIVHPEDRALWLKHLSEEPEERLHRTLEFRIIAKNGQVRWISHRCRKVWDRHNHLLGRRGSNLDITEEKHLRQEANRAQQLASLGVLAGGIAHDFNNLLGVILGNLSLAQHSCRVPSIRGEDPQELADAMHATLRARDLAGQLLTFAKGGAPRTGAVRMDRLLKETAVLVLSGTGIQCRVEAPPDIWPAQVDNGQIGQVLHNLLLNARQAMSEGGRVDIRCANLTLTEAMSGGLPAGSYLQVTLADNGPGIPSEVLPRIFEPYYTTKTGGNGLGLATSHAIVQRHGGSLTVISPPGQGAVFTLLLPASETEPPAVAESAEAGDSLPMGRGRLLVMDDEKMLRQLARSMLNRLGYEVETAASGEEGLRLYRRARAEGRDFTMILADLTVPGGMGGRDMARLILAENPLACLIVCSGYANNDVMADHRRHGFRAALRKPYQMAELAETLSMALREQEEYGRV